MHHILTYTSFFLYQWSVYALWVIPSPDRTVKTNTHRLFETIIHRCFQLIQILLHHKPRVLFHFDEFLFIFSNLLTATSKSWINTNRSKDVIFSLFSLFLLYQLTLNLCERIFRLHGCCVCRLRASKQERKSIAKKKLWVHLQPADLTELSNWNLKFIEKTWIS